MRRPRTGSLAGAGAAVCAALVAAGAGCKVRSADLSDADAPPPELGAAADRPVRIVYPSAPSSFVEVAAEIERSVVNLRSRSRVAGGPASVLPGGDEHALGSGFIFGGDGFVVTNDHVIAHAHDVVVVLHDGTELAARIVGRDPKLDVALLQVEVSPALVPVRLGDSDALQIGEWVVAAGNPFGAEVSVSAGVVSALGRSQRAEIVARAQIGLDSFIQTDAAVHAGNTGGPLLNTAGEVVGVLVVGDRRGGGRVGYAVPINRVKEIMPQLSTDGVVSRSWLGVKVLPVTADYARQVRLAEVTGALVTDVIPGSPAAKAGVRRGDVVLQFDGKTVDHRNLPWIASTSGVHRQVVVQVWRGGAQERLSLVTERMPE